MEYGLPDESPPSLIRLHGMYFAFLAEFYTYLVYFLNKLGKFIFNRSVQVLQENGFR